LPMAASIDFKRFESSGLIAKSSAKSLTSGTYDSRAWIP
jgi:hypothetical protein